MQEWERSPHPFSQQLLDSSRRQHNTSIQIQHLKQLRGHACSRTSCCICDCSYHTLPPTQGLLCHIEDSMKPVPEIRRANRSLSDSAAVGIASAESVYKLSTTAQCCQCGTVELSRHYFQVSDELAPMEAYLLWFRQCHRNSECVPTHVPGPIHACVIVVQDAIFVVSMRWFLMHSNGKHSRQHSCPRFQAQGEVSILVSTTQSQLHQEHM
jgi:hypothetical protein